MQVSCDSNRGPSATDSEGWSGYTAGGAPAPPSQASAGCTPHAVIANTSTVPSGAAAVLQYSPPAGSQIVGGSVTLQASGNNAQGGPGYGGATYLQQGSLDMGRPYYTCGSATCGPWVQPLADQAGPLYVAAGCWGTCGPYGEFQSVTVDGLHALLRSDSSPTGSGFGGSVLAATAHGTADLNFTAGDPSGPGVYQVSVSIDGKTMYQATPNTNAGRCAPTGTDATSGAWMFDFQQPCLRSEAVDVPVDTTGFSDGQHDLAVVVIDAAQNRSTVLHQTITTANRTTVASAGGESLAPPSQPTATPVGYVLQLDARSQKATAGVLRSRFSRSAFTLAGVVMTTSGTPAPGVPVTVRSSPTGGGAAVTVAQTISDGAGRFSVAIPRGDSRSLQLAAGAGVISWKQVVTPSIALRIRSLSRARLLFSGRVGIDWGPGPRPVVEIEDRTPLGWQPVTFAALSRHGTFRKLYPSSPITIGYRYAFRAVVAASTNWDGGVSVTRVARVRG
jgi:hypothetical protein